MAFSSEVTSLFSHDTRSRGEEYFRRGAVRILRADGARVEAEVEGTLTYEVALVRIGERLDVSCTCPWFLDQGNLCKHVWATLLAADEERIFDGNVSSIWKDRAADDEEEETDEFEDTELPPLAGGGRLLDWRPRSPAVRPPQPPQWKQKLDDVLRPDSQAREHAPATHPHAKLEYMLFAVPVSSYPVDVRVSWSRPVRGRWSRPQAVRMSGRDLRMIPSPEDREILTLLAGIQTGQYLRDSSELDFSRARIPTGMRAILLPLLCRTGRFHIEGTVAEGPFGPLEWDDGEPWQLRAALHRDEALNRYRLDTWLERGDESMPLGEPLALLEDGFLITRTSVARLEHFGAFSWIPLLRRSELTIPLVDGEDFVDTLMSHSSRLPIALPEDLRWEEVRTLPRPRLLLRRDADGKTISGKLAFEYGDAAVDSASQGDVVLGERKILLREREAEQNAFERLVDEGFTWNRWADHPWSIRPKLFAPAVSRLVSNGWKVEAEGKLYRTAGSVKMEVSSGVDWFELHGSADFEGSTLSLPALLAAARKGQNTVLLDDGSFGIIPEEWIRRYAPLAMLGDGDQDGLRFSAAQVGLIDALLASRPEVSFDETYARARAKLAGFEGVAPLDAPPGFRGELRHYQKDGLGWFEFLRQMRFGGCLADDMGLGKTIQVLALLESRRGIGKPSLVVVPKSLVFNWRNESEKFTPELRLLDFTGPGRGEGTEHFSDYDLVITTYGTLRREAAKLAEVEFDYAILDEAQAVKNAATQSAKAVRLLRAEHRLALSGTPVENHLGELWSLFEFLNPGFLGSAAAFRLLGGGARNPDEETRKILSRALRPFILRRTKEQVATELPAKIEQTIFCELDRKQRKLYDELRTFYRASLQKRIEDGGIRKAKIHVLEALLRLRQAACDPRLIGPVKGEVSSAKLEALLPQIEEVLDEGHKILVFSQFTSFLALVREELDGRGVPYCYLDGKSRDREQQVERFQTDEGCGLFLISLKAGGLGLNLTAAEYVYLLDPWWNPAVEAQAVDRAHRIGQTRQVFAYRLVAKDTVEEKILELQKSKRDLADAIINADNSLIGKLTAEDLEMLLS